MIIGIPKEIKNSENRVAMTPSGVNRCIKYGHTVYVESCAGLGSAIPDSEYIDAGAIILPTPIDVYNNSEMIIKVKEPQKEEYNYFREGQILFTYLHLAADSQLVKILMEKRVIALAYETVELDDGSLPLLTPMSCVAGRMAAQIGAQLLTKTDGGKGILIGGVPGVEPANVVVIGGGVVGLNAARVALGMGATVTILEKSTSRMSYIDMLYSGRVKTLYSNEYNISKAVKKADLLIGAVLITGAKAPNLVTENMVKTMSKGSVIIDVAIDQGGTIETIDRVTSHKNPTYDKYGIIHYSVANIPGDVPRTSTFALTNVTIEYILDLVNKGLSKALLENTALLKGLNIFMGKVTSKVIANQFGYNYYDPYTLL